MREEQRDNVVEVVYFGDAEPVGELAQHLDAVAVLLKPDAHRLSLEFFQLGARDAVHLGQRLPEEPDGVVHEVPHRGC